MDLYILIIGHCLLNIIGSTSSQTTQYVLEGRDTVLKCRVPPPIPDGARLYWLGPRAGSLDMYAIDDVAHNQDYKVDLDRSVGRYDLSISRATYQRNNGLFTCNMRTETSGDLHSESINLTVLIKPGSPRIDPMRPTVVQGSQLRLTCSSRGGSPDPEIIWYRQSDGRPLQESVLKPGGSRDVPTTSVLTLSPTREDDGEEYMCEVRNRALSPREKMVASVRLNVNYYPIVKISPSNPVRAIRGEDVTLTCDVDAKPSVNRVNWIRGGSFINSRPTLTLSKVDSSDSGRYICQADNNLGRPGEAEVTIDVLYPPLVAVPPSREVTVGGDVIVACNVTANPPPESIFWTKMDDPLFRQNNEILRLTKVDAKDHGVYVCHALSVLSPSGSREITLEGNATIGVKIRHAPGESFIAPTHPVAVEGKRKILTCGASPPGYPDTKYRWWRDGGVVMNIGENYTIPIASEEHIGPYYCQPFNLLGNGTIATADLRVFKAPRITEGLKPTAVYRRERADLKLSCRAEGNPTPETKWYKDGLEIKPSDGLFDIITNVSTLGPRQGVVIQSTLLFRGPERVAGGRRTLRPEDRGSYECAFENEAERVSSTQLLRIQHPPALAHRLTRVAADVGEEATLVCRMRSHPEPNFKWSHDGNILESSGVRTLNPSSSAFSSPETSRFKVLNTDLGEDLYQSTLSIVGVVQSDYGSYKCEAFNREGSTKTLLSLQPKGIPGPPESPRVVEAGVDTVQVGFEPGFDGGYPILLNYSVRVEPDRPDLRKKTVVCDAFQTDFLEKRYLECIVKGLNPDTGYRLFLYSENPRGRSPLSDPVVTRTWVDPSLIPAPSKVLSNPSTGQVVLSTPDISRLTHVRLEARLQLKHGDHSAWDDVPQGVPLGDGGDDGEFGAGVASHRIQPLGNETKLRARICVQGNPSLCSQFTNATYVSQLPILVSSVPTNPIAIIVAVVCVFIAACGFLAAICCCYRRNRQSNIKKKAAAGGDSHRSHSAQQAPPPPYYTVGLDNKGMDGSSSFDRLDDHSKSFIFGAHQQQQQHQYQNLAPGYHEAPLSYMDPNCGASVHSQDSLWRVKGGPDSHIPQSSPEFCQLPPQPPHSPTHDRLPYPYSAHPQGGYDDYAHYPPISGGYPGMGGVDPYGMSPHHFADGPDEPNFVNSYMGSDLSGLPPMAQEGGRSPHGVVDESMESGFSTPNSRNRRVIREIIV